MARLNTADSPVKGEPAMKAATTETQYKKPKTFRKIGLKTPLHRRFRDVSALSPSEEKDDGWDLPEEPRTAAKSTARGPRTGDMLSQVKSRTQRMGKKPSGGIFDIFSDSDGASESAGTLRKKKGKKMEEKSALKLQPVNSMLLLAPQQQSRGRQARKSETYDYNKENDPVEHQQDDDEYSSGISRNPSDASSRRSVRAGSVVGAGVPDLSINRISISSSTSASNNLFLRYRQPKPQQDDNESVDNSFDSLDDFIASDDDEPSFHESSDGEAGQAEEEEEDITIKPKPAAKRRLVRGRRPNPEEELKKALLNSPQKGTFQLEPSLPAEFVRLSPEKEKPRRFFQSQQDVSEQMSGVTIDSDSDDPSSQLQQDLFDAATRFEASSNAPDDNEKDDSETSPSSPSSNRLRSPTRHKVHIPPTPHRESSDAFWSQEATDNWVDKHSPLKIDKFLQEFEESSDDASTPTNRDAMPRRQGPPKMRKLPSKTALKKADIAERKAIAARRKSFDDRKAALAEHFFKTLDDAVSGGKVQQLAEESGGVRIIWSKTLQTTAGRASWKREKLKAGGESPPEKTSKHHASIELAERIIDCEDRLLKTLAHEYCHLANFMISNVHNNPHGASFKAWGAKCQSAMRDHPVYGGGRVEVTTRHTYKIDYKYVWSCVDCGQTYGRHSKSINPTKSSCGKCHGLLQQIKPKPRNVSPRKKETPAAAAAATAAVDNMVEVLGAVRLG